MTETVAPGESVTDQICAAVKLGIPPIVAALKAGVSEADFAEWMMRGIQNTRGDWRYHRFSEAVLKAEAEAEGLLIGRVRTAATEGNWSAAAWLLERRWPERYTKKSINEKEPKPSERGAAARGDEFADVDNVTAITAAKK